MTRYNPGIAFERRFQFAHQVDSITSLAQASTMLLAQSALEDLFHPIPYDSQFSRFMAGNSIL